MIRFGSDFHWHLKPESNRIQFQFFFFYELVPIDLVPRFDSRISYTTPLALAVHQSGSF